MLALFFAGGIGSAIAFGFAGLIAAAWFLEDSDWQISERTGVFVLIIFIPIILLEWRFRVFGTQLGASFTATGLARLILFLSAIKLFQRKTDRDWVFIYIISFFEVLLAASLYISPLFVASFLAYLLFTISAIITFEIRKTSRDVAKKSSLIDETSEETKRFALKVIPFSRLSLISGALLLFITLLAVPLFFSLPRVGGAGLGSSIPGGGSAITGFSDSVKLGEIGRLKQSDETVMRVRLENVQNLPPSNIYWRGIALDKFDGKSWSRSKTNRVERIIRGRNGFFSINFTGTTKSSVKQTFYLEPTGTPVLFSLSKPVTVRGHFKALRKDGDGSIKSPEIGFERTSYVIRSDISRPTVDQLENDRGFYPVGARRHLQLPRRLDRRIARLARRVIWRSRAKNNFEKAGAIETFLRTRFGYTLEMKAGGHQPLSDFLFNIREGHCEYFATAMAIMLRTQGVATRVVNGFQQGDYNETAGMYVVRQRHAHSWVEVYFPETNSWITFDPTPADGQFSEASNSSIAGSLNKYFEAFEAFWIQYFVSYDSQEQRSLFQSAQDRFAQYGKTGTSWFQVLQERLLAWWEDVRGDKGLRARFIALIYAVAYVLAFGCGLLVLFWFYRKIARSKIWKAISAWFKNKKNHRIVEFYEQLLRILDRKGFKRLSHQTPLEFAYSVNLPEAIEITEKYNRVRFGNKNLSAEESKKIENLLDSLRRDNEI